MILFIESNQPTILYKPVKGYDKIVVDGDQIINVSQSLNPIKISTDKIKIESEVDEVIKINPINIIVKE